MNINWLESIILGLISGLAEFLPVSAQAHRILFMRIFSGENETSVLRFFAHLGALAALLLATRARWGTIIRERAILNTPKRKRARQPNPQALTEWRMVFQIFIWCLIGLLFYLRASSFGQKLSTLTILLFANGLLLYLPTRMASGDKDHRAITPLDGACVGIAGALGALPGISPVGALLSAFSARGAGRTYSCDLSLLILIPYLVVAILMDVAGILSVDMGIMTVSVLSRGLVLTLFSFVGAYLGIEILRRWTVRMNLERFSFYSFGLALLSFVLYLTV